MLKKKHKPEMKLIAQMGLFSELYFLFEIINNFDIFDQKLRNYFTCPGRVRDAKLIRNFARTFFLQNQLPVTLF